MPDVVRSHNDVPIRLTDERWSHITEEHSELAGMRFEILEAVQQPASIYHGNQDELLAVKEIEAGKWLVVIYRELVDDGFIITAFMTRRMSSLESRKLIWSALS
jgi:hypothetical protein